MSSPRVTPRAGSREPPPSAAVDFRLAGALAWVLYAVGGLLLWARQSPECWRTVRQGLTRHLPTKTLLAGLVQAERR